MFTWLKGRRKQLYFGRMLTFALETSPSHCKDDDDGGEYGNRLVVIGPINWRQCAATDWCSTRRQIRRVCRAAFLSVSSCKLLNCLVLGELHGERLLHGRFTRHRQWASLQSGHCRQPSQMSAFATSFCTLSVCRLSCSLHPLPYANGLWPAQHQVLPSAETPEWSRETSQSLVK